LGLQTALGTALIAIKGYAAPEVAHTYTRARELCQHLGDRPRLLQVLLGLHAFYVVRGQFHTARELGEQCLAFVQHVHSPTRLLNVHYALGVTLFHLGEFVAARAHLEQGMALYEAPHHRPHPNLQDPGVICLAYGAWALLVLGYPDQAVTRVQEARLLAQQLAHPFSLAFALHCVTCVHQLRREARDTQEQAQAVITLSTDQGFPFWKAYNIVLQGWARVEQGQAEGLAQMQQGLSTWQALGAEVGRTWSLAVLAEAYGRAEHTEAGLTVLADALAAVASTGERFWEAELYRLKGELLLRASPQPPASEVVPPDVPRPLPDTAAEACFHYALTLARRQQAKMWELRAARSLSRLWQQQGKRTEAYDLLAPIYGWFTEGFDTPDLQEAKALLEEVVG
jgi:predicted ATPase